MTETYNIKSGTFDNLLPGDLFFGTGPDGKTYKVPWSEMESVAGRLIPVLHIKNIRSGSVKASNHDFITDLNGNKTSQTSFSSGEWLVYGDEAILAESTGDWDFGPLTKTHTRKNFHNFLWKCSNFNGDVSNVSVDAAEDISYMFSNCSKFNKPLTHFNTSKVNTMRALFQACSAFNQPVNHFNTSACENFMMVFQQASGFRGALSNWDVDHGVTFLEMFAATKYTPDLSSWEPERAAVFQGMFQNSSFNGNISGWNTSSAVNMDRMFNGNSSFNQDLTKWCVSKITRQPLQFAPSLNTSKYPKWGTCPRGEDGSDPIIDEGDKSCEDVCYDNWIEALSHCDHDDSACTQAAWGAYSACIYACSDGNLTREQAEELAHEQACSRQEEA